MVVDAIACDDCPGAGLRGHGFYRSIGNVTGGPDVLPGLVCGRRTQGLRRQEVDSQHHKKKDQQNLDLAKGKLHWFVTSLLGILLTSVGKNEQEKARRKK